MASPLWNPLYFVFLLSSFPFLQISRFFLLIITHFSFSQVFGKKMGALICCMSEQNEEKSLERNLEKKISEIRRNKFGQSKLKSIDTIVMLFPMFKERLKTLRAMFQQYGKFQIQSKSKHSFLFISHVFNFVMLYVS